MTPAKKKALALLMFSLATGVGGVFVGRIWMNDRVASAIGNEKTAQIVVARHHVPAGHILISDDLGFSAWSVRAAMPGYFTDVSKVVGHSVNQDIYEGQPILEPQLSSDHGMAAVIKQGDRAIAIKVSDVTDVAGFVMPGATVDVMSSIPDAKGEMVSLTLVQSVRVLAIAQETSKPDKAKIVGSVTLEVTPEQAERIVLAEATGKIGLVIRKTGEANDSTKAVRRDDLFPTPSISPSLGKKLPDAGLGDGFVEIIRGTETGGLKP